MIVVNSCKRGSEHKAFTHKPMGNMLIRESTIKCWSA